MNEPFQILKFRSMHADAEDNSARSGRELRDPRVTRVGAILRRTRLDELPQLVNVLRGEMSLVGPRPERPAFVPTLDRQIPFYGVRHSVRTGHHRLGADQLRVRRVAGRHQTQVGV